MSSNELCLRTSVITLPVMITFCKTIKNAANQQCAVPRMAGIPRGFLGGRGASNLPHVANVHSDQKEYKLRRKDL